MVLDLIQLAPPVHKVGADKAPVRAVEASEDAQSITPGDQRDVAMATVLRRVCVSLGVRVGVKLTSRKGNCKLQLPRWRRWRMLDIRRQDTSCSWQSSDDRQRVDIGVIRGRRQRR
jgi:hypothetical protein